MEFPQSPELCPTLSLGYLCFSSHTVTIHLKEMPWRLVMALPLSTLLRLLWSLPSVCSLLFTANTPSSRSLPGEWDSKQTSPGIMPRAGDCALWAPQRGLTSAPHSGACPAALPPGCPQESLRCWAPLRGLPSLWQHPARKGLESHTCRCVASFTPEAPGTQGSALCSLSQSECIFPGLSGSFHYSI